MKSVEMMKKVHRYELNLSDEKSLIEAVFHSNVVPENVTLWQAFTLLAKAKKIARGIPVAYVLKTVPFLNTTLSMRPPVLIARPETELLTEKVVQQIKKSSNAVSVLDMCTGSGAIAVAIAKNTSAQVTGCDLDILALALARKNARQNKVKVVYFKSNMFARVHGTFDLIVCNPPYIPTAEIRHLDDSVKRYESHRALDGGKDGLEFYRILAREAPTHLNAGGTLWLEIGHDQGTSVLQILEENFEQIEVVKDYSGHDRMVHATKKE